MEFATYVVKGLRNYVVLFMVTTGFAMWILLFGWLTYVMVHLLRRRK